MDNGNQLQIRLTEAFVWLRRNKELKQKDIAQLMGITESTISRNIKSSAERVNKDFIIELNNAVGNIFNLDYIINGNGDLLSSKNTQTQTEHRPIADDALTLAARLIESTEHLRQELHAELEEIRELKQQLAALIRAASYSPTPLMAADPNADYHAETTGTKTETNTQ